MHNALFTLAADPAAAAPAIGVMLVTAAVTIVIGGIIWGLIILLTSGPVGQKKLGAGPSFKTGFTISVINGVLSFLLGFVPLLGLLMIPISFVVAMFSIHKLNGISLGRSAIMTLIGWVVWFVIAIVIGIIVAALVLALGMAGGAAH